MNDQSVGRTPADFGLSGLGLVMQLAGSLFAALTSMFGFVALIASARMGSMGGDSPVLWYLLIAGSGVTRSLIHRAAGSNLLYGHDPFRGIHHYLIASAINVMALLAFFIGKVHAPAEVWLPMAGVFSVWPVTLFVAIHLPGIQPLADHIPVTEDKGFEGASILMLVLGLSGAIISGVGLYVLIKAPGATHGIGALFLVVMLVLFIRSILHVMAGSRGGRETHVDRAVEATNRYADFGVIASFIVGGIFLILMMMGGADATSLIMIMCVVWALLAWPMIVRRFFSERQFADMMDGSSGSHARSPDLGMSSLGWLLLAMGLIVLASELPAVLLGHGHDAMRGGGGRLGDFMSIIAPATGRSPWWSIGVASLEVWAGVELIRMGELHRIAATAFGAVATVVQLYIFWPVIHAMGHIGLRAGPDAAGVYGLIGLNLVIPVTTLILANRGAVPHASARIVPRDPGDPGAGPLPPGGGGTSV
jgi:hypothetical protein